MCRACLDYVPERRRFVPTRVAGLASADRATRGRVAAILLGPRETASRLPDCAASLRRAIPNLHLWTRNRACNPSHSTRFRWHLSPRPSSRPRPPTRVCARVGAHAGRCPIRRERERAGGADVDCSSGESRAEATVGLICRQHRRSRRTDQGRPSICPALSSERRSGQRSAITRAGDRVAAMRKYTFGRRRQISGGGVR